MANICSYKAIVKGKKENRDKFLEGLRINPENDDIWIGYGSSEDFNIEKETDNVTYFSGAVKWSLHNSLISSALDMRRDQEKLKNNNEKSAYYGLTKDKKILTYAEACKEYDVEFEAWAEESGSLFCEHFIYEKDKEPFEEEYDYDEKEINGNFRVMKCPDDFMVFKLDEENLMEDVVKKYYNIR